MKFQSGFTTVEALLVLFFVVFIGYIAWFVYQRDQQLQQTATTQAPNAVVAQLKQQVTKKYSYASADTSQWVAQMGSGAGVTAAGYDYAVSTQSFPSIYFGLKADYNPAKAKHKFPGGVNGEIQNVLKADGYTIVANKYTVTGTGSAKPTYTTYVNDGTTCLDIYDANQNVVTVSCYTQDNVVHAFARVKPFVTGYLAAHPELKPQNVVFGPVTVKDQSNGGVITASKSPQYGISEAVVTVNGQKKLVLYYNTQWQYVTQANDEYGFPCSDYAANPELQTVMQGQVCLGDKGQMHFGTGTSATQ
ncbi:MAG TPA: hypothetical protein VFH39_00985 [Candidatus Saccharimonadales bacterium]|nr:hypothetical protein [Candidatus Saccharimonadales bacterium]